MATSTDESRQGDDEENGPAQQQRVRDRRSEPLPRSTQWVAWGAIVVSALAASATSYNAGRQWNAATGNLALAARAFEASQRPIVFPKLLRPRLVVLNSSPLPDGTVSGIPALEIQAHVRNLGAGVASDVAVRVSVLVNGDVTPIENAGILPTGLTLPPTVELQYGLHVTKDLAVKALSGLGKLEVLVDTSCVSGTETRYEHHGKWRYDHETQDWVLEEAR